MLAYSFDNGLSIQLNVQNLFDKRYFLNVRSNISNTAGATFGDFTGGWALPGEGRAARLSVFYSF
jgi:catecholate siderophore receptor